MEKEPVVTSGLVILAIGLIASVCSQKQHKTSTRSEVFCQESALTIFVKFTGKHLCQSLFFNKVACLKPATFKRRGSGTGISL